MTEEDDPVVYEMDVYLNQEMAKDINVVQYPLRPFYRPLDLPSNVSVREENQMLEQQYELDLGDSYNDAAPEHLQIRHQTMNSAVVAPSTHHAIGIVRKGQLHLTPVHRMYQMRPSFSHIDNAADGEEMDASADDGNLKSEMKQLQVQFKKKETDKAVEYRKKSFAHKLAIEAAETWVPLTVHGPDDETSQKAMSDLVYDTTPATSDEFNTSQTGYLKNLRFAVSSTSTGVPKMPITAGAPEVQGTLSQSDDLSTMTCEEQVRNLLVAAQVITFSQMRQLATAAQDAEEVLGHLQTYGDLVNGCWVLKSNICYEFDTNAAACRDFILIQFQEREIISRHAFRETANVSAWCLKEILSRLCNRVNSDTNRQSVTASGGQWQLKEEPDMEFMESHPDLVSEYNSYWETRRGEIDIEYDETQFEEEA